MTTTSDRRITGREPNSRARWRWSPAQRATSGAPPRSRSRPAAPRLRSTRVRRERTPTKVAQEIRAAGGQAEVFIADIADASAVKTMADGILEALRPHRHTRAQRLGAHREAVSRTEL